MNHLPLRFDSDVFKGGFISFEDDKSNSEARDLEISQRLDSLRSEHCDTTFFYRSGDAIFCIPYSENAPALGSPRTFDIFADFQLANALARNALMRCFRDAGRVITAIRPISFILTDHNLTPDRQDIFGIYPQYSLDVRPLAPHEGRITGGVLVEFSVKQVFLKNAAEIAAEGVPVEGLYVVMPEKDRGDVPLEISRKYLGRIESVSGPIAKLSDSDLTEVGLTCPP